MADEEDELGPIGGLVLSFVVVAVGWFMTGATNYVLAIGPFSTGIGMPIVGWGFVLFGALGLLGSGIEFREEYLGGGEPAGGGQDWPERQVHRPESEQSRQQTTDTQEGPSRQQTSTQRHPPRSPDQQARQEQTSNQRGQQPQRQQRQPQQGQTGLQCPKCQQHVAAGKTYCPQCGTRVR